MAPPLGFVVVLMRRFVVGSLAAVGVALPLEAVAVVLLSSPWWVTLIVVVVVVVAFAERWLGPSPAFGGGPRQRRGPCDTSCDT